MKAKGMRAGGVAVKGMKAGGVANKGMHRMPDGTMMENSDMKTMGKTMGVAPSYSNTAKKSGNTAKREDAGPAKNKVRGAGAAIRGVRPAMMK